MKLPDPARDAKASFGRAKGQVKRVESKTKRAQNQAAKVSAKTKGKQPAATERPTAADQPQMAERPSVSEQAEMAEQRQMARQPMAAPAPAPTQDTDRFGVVLAVVGVLGAIGVALLGLAVANSNDDRLLFVLIGLPLGAVLSIGVVYSFRWAGLLDPAN